jgi:DNA-binding MarR family transcriptional regulator
MRPFGPAASSLFDLEDTLAPDTHTRCAGDDKRFGNDYRDCSMVPRKSGSMERQTVARSQAERQNPELESSSELADAAKLAGWVLPGMNYPTYRLSLVAKAMNRVTVRRLSAANELTQAEWRVISRIATSEGGAATVGQLAELSWADRAEVSRAATKLEKRRLVERRKDPADGRMEVLSLTRMGQKKYQALVGDRQAFHEALLAGLDTKERHVLDLILAKIALRLVEMSSK